jgi:CheY-like chemotaxis protein
LNAKLILIVDAHPSDQTICQNLLQKMGYHFISAYDGIECIHLAERVLPDLILLELHVPGKSGIDAFLCMQGHPHLKRIPVIAITSSINGEDHKKLRELGFSDCLAKPITASSLKPMIERILSWW